MDKAKVYTHNLASDIIENFEDLLEEKGISIPCDDANEEKERWDGGNTATIYGTEYGNLMDAIEEVLISALKNTGIDMVNYIYK